VSRTDQLAALASPARVELIDVLTRLGKASLAELAQALGRPADGLYYHVRALEKVGLVKASGSRKVAGRTERLVRAAGREVMLRYATRPPARARAGNAVAAGILRLGVRDFRRGLAQPRNRREGPRPGARVLRPAG